MKILWNINLACGDGDEDTGPELVSEHAKEKACCEMTCSHLQPWTESYTGTLRDPNAGCEPKVSGHCPVDEMLGNKKENGMRCELPLNHKAKIAMLIRTRFIH